MAEDTMSEKAKAAFPTGHDYLALVIKIEDECQRFTDKSLPSLGVKAPKCIEALGTVLSYGERVAACHWNCPGNDADSHMLQYIAGRADSFGRAAVRLTLMGFYDEALSLVRSLGEIANLLFLFDLDAQELADWKASDFAARNKRFKPSQIRCRIADKGKSVPMSQERY